MQPVFLPKGMGNIQIEYLGIVGELDKVSQIDNALKSDASNDESYFLPSLADLIK